MLVTVGELFLLELNHPEDGVRLGLGEVTQAKKQQDGSSSHWEGKWFELIYKAAWTWVHPELKLYMKKGEGQSDSFELACFRLQVTSLHGPAARHSREPLHSRYVQRAAQARDMRGSDTFNGCSMCC
ncbi:MAG: hypothetical protein SGPRY_004790 [Prymnesium sp.]